MSYLIEYLLLVLFLVKKLNYYGLGHFRIIVDRKGKKFRLQFLKSFLPYLRSFLIFKKKIENFWVKD